MAVTTTDLSLKQVEAFLKNHAELQPETLLQLILLKQTDEALVYLQSYEQHGLDYQWLIQTLLEKLKTMLLVKKGLVKEPSLTKIIEATSLKDLSRLMKLLLESYSLTKQSPIEALPLMIGIVEFSEG